MSNFDRDRGGRSGGGNFGGGFGGDRGGRGGGRDGGRRERPEMFSVTCDECGKNCEVPFRPTGDRPVYCSNCFGGNDNSRDDRGRGRDRDDRGGRDDRGERKMYSATCDQCGNDCELPFKPTSDKPVFCSDCFVKEDKPKRGGADYKADFDALNAKLDMVIKALGISEAKKEVVKIKLPKAAKVDELDEIDEISLEAANGDAFDEIPAPAKEKAPKKAAKKAE